MEFNHKKNLYAYIQNAMLNRFMMNGKGKGKNRGKIKYFYYEKK